MERIREVDGLRAVAVSAVLVFHWTPRVLPAGFIGVDLFFVISGLVITSGLLREIDAGSISLRRFYTRRFFRIVPPLAAMLAFFVAVTGHYRIPALVAILSAMNWSKAFGQGFSGGIFGHTWSLSIEEQFYLLWPMCCCSLLARGGIREALVTAIGCVALWRIAAFWMFGLYRVYNGLDTHSDGLLIGCLLATNRQIELKHWWLLPAGGLAALAAFGDLNKWWMMRLAIPVVNLCSAGLVAAAVRPSRLLSHLLTLRPIQWMGTRSYAIYLWHYPIGELVSRRSATQLAACFALTFLAAEISMRLVERRAFCIGRMFGRTVAAPLPSS